MDWIIKARPKSNNYLGEVCISFVNDKKKSVAIRFCDYSFKKITSNFHIICGLQGKKLYFKMAEPRVGYKLSGARPFDKQPNLFFKVKKDLLPGIIEGEFNLEFDERLELWFIDLESRLTADGINWNRKVRYKR